MAGLRDIRRRELTPWSTDDKERSEYTPLNRFMLDHHWNGWYGFECDDIRTILRLAVEACPEDDLVYDLTELITGGYYDSADDVVADAEDLLSADFALSRRVVVLTEGATDKWILERSLRLLRPDLYDFFTFMDFEGARVAGGAGALASMVKAFVASGILNRVVAVFDNDTAGAGAMRGLEATVLPPNIAVLRLPELSLAQAYPTLGPSGDVTMNVNGLAASLELYLGRDVLSVDGQLLPVQWKGFDEKLKKYQGEVTGKAGIHERFRVKLAACERDPASVNEGDWAGLEAVATALCGAFAAPITNDAYAERPATSSAASETSVQVGVAVERLQPRRQ